MDTTEAINSTFEDRLIHQNTRMEKEKDQGIRNVVQQSIYEEKLANNGLYASVLIHFFIILSTLGIIVLNVNLIVVFRENNPDEDSLAFSLLNFDLNIISKNAKTYSYFCFGKEVSETNDETICTMREDCVKRGLNATQIKTWFDLNCEHFIELRNIGIIYIVILVLGNLLGATSAVIVLLLLYDRISLEKCEAFIFFTKFESATYFIGFFIYFSFVKIFMDMNSQFLKRNFYLIILFFVTFGNFLIFRRSFYNKLRIKARIL